MSMIAAHLALTTKSRGTWTLSADPVGIQTGPRVSLQQQWPRFFRKHGKPRGHDRSYLASLCCSATTGQVSHATGWVTSLGRSRTLTQLRSFPSGLILFSRGHAAMSGDMLGRHSGALGATGISGVEAWQAAQHLRTHGTAPQQSYPALNVSHAETKSHWPTFWCKPRPQKGRTFIRLGSTTKLTVTAPEVDLKRLERVRKWVYKIRIMRKYSERILLG